MSSASEWYCKQKTYHIKDLARTYYNLGKIDKDIFETLMSYDAKVGLKEY